MTINDLRAHYKNGYDFERKTGLTHVNWTNWGRKGYIPILSQMRIERITKGLLKADIDHTLEGDNNV